MTYTIGKWGPVHAESVTDEIILQGFKNLFEAMTEGFDRLDRKIDRRIAELDNRMMRRFDERDERLDGHERRITALETQR